MMKLRFEILLVQIFGIALLASMICYVMSLPLVIPNRISISIILGILVYAIFSYCSLTTIGISVKMKVQTVKSDYLFIVIYVLCLVIAMLPYNTYNSSFYSPLASLNSLNIAKLFASVLLTSFLPGYVLLKIVCNSRGLAFPNIGIGVLSILLSFIVTSLTSYLHWIIKCGFAKLNSTLLFSYALLLIVFIVRSQFICSRIKERKMPKGINTLSFYEALVLVCLSSYLIWVFHSTHFAPQTLQILHDELEHAGLTQRLLRGWQSWQAVETGSDWSYPYFFHLILISAQSLSNVPFFNTYLSFFFLLMVPAFAFHSMAQMIFRNRKNVPLLATTIFSVFSGFGWIYVRFLNGGIDSYALGPSTILNASQRTYDIVYSTWLPIYIAPYTVDLAILFLLVGLTRCKQVSGKTLSILTVLLVTFGGLVHVEKMLMLAFLLFILSLLYVLNVAKSAYRLKIVLCCYVIGLIMFFLLDFLAPYQIHPKYSSMIWYAISLCVIGSILMLIGEKVKARAHSLILKINRKHLKYALACLALASYLILSVALFYSFHSYRFNEQSVPLWFIPLKMGAAGLLSLFGLFFSARQRNEVDSFIALCIGTIFMQLLLYHLPFALVSIALPEFRIFRDLLWSFLSIVAAYGCTKIVEVFERSIDKTVLKHFILCLFLFMMFVSAIPSHFLKVGYFMSAQPSMSEGEMDALNYLSAVEIPSGSSILTGLPKKELYAVTGTPAVSLTNPDFAALVFSSKSPSTVIYLLHYFNISYIYLNSEDLQFLRNRYGHTFFVWLLHWLPSLFNNSTATIYKVPPLSPPLDESKTAVITGDLLHYETRAREEENAEKTGVSFDYITIAKGSQFSDYYAPPLLAAIMSLNYTTISKFDSSLLDYSTIFMPDSNLTDTRASQLVDWIKSGRVLIAINSQGQGSFGEFLAIRESGKYVSADSIVDIKGEYTKISRITIPELQLSDNSTTIIANYTFKNTVVSPFAFLKNLGQGRIIYLEMAPILGNIAGCQDAMKTLTWISDFLEEHVNLTLFIPSAYRRVFYVKNIGQMCFQGETCIETPSIVFGLGEINEVTLKFSNHSDIGNVELSLENVTLLDTEFKGGIPATIHVKGNTTVYSLDSNNYAGMKFNGEVLLTFYVKPTNELRATLKNHNHTELLFRDGVLLLDIQNPENVELVVRDPMVANNGTTTFDSLFVSYPYGFVSHGGRGTFDGKIKFAVELSEEKVILLKGVQLNGDLRLDVTTTNAINDDLSFFINYPLDFAFFTLVILVPTIFVCRKLLRKP